MFTWSFGWTGFLDHLVRVHVRLGAGPRLPDHQREVVVELAIDHLGRSGYDGVAEFRRDVTLCHVHQSAGLLDHTKRPDDRDRLAFPADGKVDD
jgi:hypothetical protein